MCAAVHTLTEDSMKLLRILLLGLVALGVTDVSTASTKKREPNAVEEWLFQLAMKAAPPKHAWKPPAGPHAKETPEQREARYRDIVGHEPFTDCRVHPRYGGG